MGMINTQQIDEAIQQITHVKSLHGGAKVWVYGWMHWANPTAFEFTCLGDREQKCVTLLTDQVKRYRDGESDHFLVEMSSAMARIIDIERFILTDEQIEQKKRRVDTSRAW